MPSLQHEHLTERGPVRLGTGFPTKIRELRSRRGWAQLELARQAGITNTFLSRIETGRQGCSLLVADRMAAALETSREDLLGVYEKGGPADAEASRVPGLEQVEALQAELRAERERSEALLRQLHQLTRSSPDALPPDLDFGSAKWRVEPLRLRMG